MFEIKKGNKEKTNESEFAELLRQAQEEYPYDPQKQIEFFRNEQSSAKYELLGFLKVMELNLSERYQTFEVSSEGMDYIFRSLIDLSVHLKEDLPDGVYAYTLNNLENISDYILKQYEESSAWPKKPSARRLPHPGRIYSFDEHIRT